MRLGSCLAFAAVALAASLTAAAGEDAFSPEDLKFFEQNVRPILVNKCQRCHRDGKESGELTLDSREGLLEGGDSGPAIVPGKPAESVLIDAVNYGNYEMPPTGRLPQEDIDKLAEWVRRGAPWPGKVGEGGPSVRKKGTKFSNEDKAWWSFQPIVRHAPPQISNPNSEIRNAIDAFLEDRLSQENLASAPEADRRTLIRRLYFDLVGLPPEPQAVQEFQNDEAPDAYERLTDRLLANPQHGARWARHWLDLVRYAESDGYKQDSYRQAAWRYRDYVINALNSDKPYDRFVAEQLAGDEIAPHDPEALVATGYLRAGIYEYNQKDARTQWGIILNEITDVTADVFLGMGLGCARCHDHKFDPLLQQDYFRLQAFFTPILPRDDVPAATQEQQAAYRARLAEWEAKTADIRAEIDEIERPHLEKAWWGTLDRFPEDIRKMSRKKPEERSPLEVQLVKLAERQAQEAKHNVKLDKALKNEAKERWTALREQLKALEKEKPAPLPEALTVSDVGSEAPPTIIPGKKKAPPVAPGGLTILDAGTIPPVPVAVENSTGRRAALAQWLTRSDHPLTTRVITNRLWQYHFGRGLVETASDFGRLGVPPTHPELLDWLTSEFVASGWHMKRLHRELVTSSAYRRISHGPEIATLVERDPGNRWWGRMAVRRLDAEQVRDALLATTGELKLDAGGPSADVKTPERTIYTKIYRNTRDALLDVFDVPEGIGHVAQRNTTVTPNQALLMINGGYVLERAKKVSRDIMAEKPASPDEALALAYERIFGRAPTAAEKDAALDFFYSRRDPNQSGVSATAITDFCHVLLNSSEFLYVD
jgi:hypothetical protein